MSTLIRKLAWSRVANPKVAVSLSAAGLLLGVLLGATAPNARHCLSCCRCPGCCRR
jgi:hypothetical protein